MSPGNVLNATLYIFISSLSLAQRGGSRTPGSERSSFYEEMQEYCPYMQHFPPECEVTKGWQMLERMEASDPVEPHR